MNEKDAGEVRPADGLICRFDRLYHLLKEVVPYHRLAELDECFAPLDPDTEADQLAGVYSPIPRDQWPSEIASQEGTSGVKADAVYAINDSLMLVTWRSFPSQKRRWRVISRVDGRWLVTPERADNDSLNTPEAALAAAGVPELMLWGLEAQGGDVRESADSPHSATAHENPRVVAAAVEMVKEIEQHKAKAAKDEPPKTAYDRLRQLIADSKLLINEDCADIIAEFESFKYVPSDKPPRQLKEWERIMLVLPAGRKSTVSGVSSDDRAQIGRESLESNDSQAISGDSAKDRADWLKQFPEWVQEWCEDDDKIVPLRCGETWVLYADAGTVKWDRSDWFGLHYREAPPGNQFVGRLIDFADDLNLPRYADGNVPLLGDAVSHVAFGPDPWKPVVHIGAHGSNCDYPQVGERRLTYGDGGWDDVSRCNLFSRHPAIADLPGIRNDSSWDRADSNDSGDEVTVSQHGEPNKSTIVENKYSGFVGPSDSEKAPKLRVGMRVRVGLGDTSVCGWLVRPSGGATVTWTIALEDGSMTHKSDRILTPIPPPLIDNGDGTWTLEGYRMFKLTDMSDGKWVWCWAEPHGGIALSKGHRSKEAAAEDLWRRMEGVN